jgi:DNA-binding FadR family transcriptional regulator
MMNTFGVSRPTVREALRVAESLGLIQVRHGDPGGPRVLAQPSVGVARVVEGLLSAEQTSLAELLEVRAALEGAAARLAAGSSAAKLSQIDAAYRKMEKTTDSTAFAEADALFHRRIAEVSGNRLFSVILAALRDPIEAMITAGPSGAASGEERAAIIRMHGEILKAIRSGDGAAADRRSRRHLYELYASRLSAEERRRLESLRGK